MLKVEESLNSDEDSDEEFEKVAIKFKNLFKRNTRDYKKQ